MFEELSRRIRLWEILQLQFFWFSFSLRFPSAARIWRNPNRWIITVLSAIRSGKKDWKNGKNATAQFPKVCRASPPSRFINILHQEVTDRLTELSGRLTTTERDMSGTAERMWEEDQEDKPHPPLSLQSAFPAGCMCNRWKSHSPRETFRREIRNRFPIIDLLPKNQRSSHWNN